ncbi:MAG TPA: hypothetical protein VK465_11330 [Fibrobacteria bacterium]|nr:hypothetical protein [Fibrobacteria bacterium]
MSIEPTKRNLDKYDYNHDGGINHDDVEAFIMDLGHGKAGNIKALLRFQKAGGELNIEDIKELAGKGTVDGGDVLRFVEQGGKLTEQDIQALTKAGVEFTPKELAAFQTELGLKSISRFPAGTTPADLLAKASTDNTITASDVASLKGPDGKPLATAEDLLKLKELGIKVRPEDLIAFQKAGGNISGEDLVKFVDNGSKYTSKELVTLIEGGLKIDGKQLSHITTKLGITLTAKELAAANPDLTPGELLGMSTSATGLTGKDLIAVLGPDGKPTATAADLVNLQAKGGAVTPADIIAFQKAGGKITGEELARLVTKGMKFTASDLAALSKGGTAISVDQLRHIINNSQISPTKEDIIAINPVSNSTGQPYFEKVVGPVTIDPILTPGDLAMMTSLGVNVNTKDLIASNSGTPMTADELIKFVDNGGVVTSKDLVEIMKSGTKFSGKDLANLQTMGVKFTTEDLISLSKGGTPIYEDELRHILNNSGLDPTVEDVMAINPYTVAGGVPNWQPGATVSPDACITAMKLGVSLSAADLLSFPGTGGNMPSGYAGLNVEHLIQFVEAGGKLTSKDLMQFQKQFNENNGAIPLTGDDLVKLVDNGAKITPEDLVQLSKSGVTIWKDDLDHIVSKLDIRLTNAQERELNPVGEDGSRMYPT